MKRRRRPGAGKRSATERGVRRLSRHRPERTRILIVGEGRETEPNYFRGLRDEEEVVASGHVQTSRPRVAAGGCLIDDGIFRGKEPLRCKDRPPWF